MKYRIEGCTSQEELFDLVEEFLTATGENRSSETYEDTAIRLKQEGKEYEAGVMQAASEKWIELTDPYYEEKI